jgi:hypothetical protein
MPRRSKKSEDGADGDDMEPEEDYIVEKICDKRIVKGKVQYFLKWKGYPDSENTWEPHENLDCQELIQMFEDNRKKKTSKEPDKRKSTAATPIESEKRTRRSTTARDSKKTSEEEFEDTLSKRPKGGFDRGMRPDKILGATDASGELMFLMKWMDTEEADLVQAKIANVKCPQVFVLTLNICEIHIFISVFNLN